MQKGDTNHTAAVWMDQKPVYTLSSLSDPEDIRACTRRMGREVMAAYNKSMGRVDLHDQLRAKYPVSRDSKKWWRYLFWFVLNSAIVNSFILFKQASSRLNNKKRFTHLDFRQELINQLIAGFSKRKRSTFEN
ncbi:PGBD4-like protein [Mya arenaria]|uniref:PGBD4-like protein n=1 Tax=Mya arenaria TaxID=6604 RepID=A0ABY7ETF6_MYAAR|nr:PGBD4-like protein [Mya arenaria]